MEASQPQSASPEAVPAASSPHLEHNSTGTGSAQGHAARQLLSTLINEPELAEIKRHQASTLKGLAKLKNGITAINKLSADEYARCAAEYVRAARLAGQVKTDLNDISHRIASLKRKLAALQEQTGQPSAPDK